MKKGVGIISTIFYVIITVIFLMVFANMLFNWFSGIPTVRGAIGEPTKVICFGGGEDKTIHCLTKENGTEIFYFKAARSWRNKGAESTPALTNEGIYFGVNDHICAYSVAGQKLWECQDYGKKITSSIGVGTVHVCFGNKEKYYCLEKKNGLLAREFGEPDEPFISIDGQSAYYSDAKESDSIKKYKLDRAEEDWTIPLQQPIISEITVAEDTICFGTYKDDKSRLICLDKETGSSKLSYSSVSKVTTPAIDGDYVYAGIGGQVFRINLTKNLIESVLREPYDNDISTGIALNEGLACFTEGPILHCFTISTATPSEKFNVTAPATWDVRETESKPIILDGVVYFAIGDHVCAYATNSTGTFTGDEGAKWCADFDEKIATDIAGLPAKKLGVPV